MEIDVIRTHNNVIAAVSDDDLEDLKKLHVGEPYRCKIWKPRNYKFLRKFMALIKAIYRIQRHFDNIQSLRYWLTMKAGYYTSVVAPNGNIIYYAESISFSKMDEVMFDKLYNKIIDIALSHEWICKGNTRKEIDKFVNDILGYI